MTIMEDIELRVAKREDYQNLAIRLVALGQVPERHGPHVESELWDGIPDNALRDCAVEA